MKKLMLAATALAAVLMGAAGTADAGTGYPPTGSGITVDDPNPEPGQPVEITVDCGDTDGSVTVSVGGTSTTGDCVDGSVTVTITAPSADGPSTVTVTNNEGETVGTIVLNVSGTATTTPVTVPPGGLPATGSDGISTWTSIGIGLLVAGLGLFAVATVRRRSPSAA